MSIVKAGRFKFLDILRKEIQKINNENLHTTLNISQSQVHSYHTALRRQAEVPEESGGESSKPVSGIHSRGHLHKL